MTYGYKIMVSLTLCRFLDHPIDMICSTCIMRKAIALL